MDIEFFHQRIYTNRQYTHENRLNIIILLFIIYYVSVNQNYNEISLQIQ